MEAAAEAFGRDQRAIEEAAALGKPWYDPSFEGPAAIGDARLASYVAAWLRPHELAAPYASLLGSAPCAGALEQGPLADCWFLGALSTVVAHHGVASILGNTRCMHSGAFIFRFFKGGAEVLVAVDGRLPCSNDRLPAFARCLGDAGALWAPLAEKAYAKLHGSYACLGEGAEADALSDLTGGPAWLSALTAPGPEGAGLPASVATLICHLRRGGLAGVSLFSAPPPQQQDAAGRQEEGMSKRDADDPMEFTVNIPLQADAPPERLFFGRAEPAASIAQRFVQQHSLLPEAASQITAFIDAQRTAPARAAALLAVPGASADDGIMPNHSYTVLGIEAEGIEEEARILLGNPWGGGGRPSAEACGVDVAQQPGMAGRFAVTAKALGRLFNAAHLCAPLALLAPVARATGTWQAGVAGYSDNPQFVLRLFGLASDSEALLLLRYKTEPRLAGRRNDFGPIGFDIFRPELGAPLERLGSAEQLPAVAWSPFLAARQVGEVLRPGAGDHMFIVVPRQYKPGAQVHFVLEVHAGKGIPSVPVPLGASAGVAADSALAEALTAGVDDPDLAEALLLSLAPSSLRDGNGGTAVAGLSTGFRAELDLLGALKSI